MPKRLIDGDKLWTSEKLKRVAPEAFRAEYANLIPLALANGVFECTAHRVWRDVYSFNRPSFKPFKVDRILFEFERVRLLFRWQEADEKTWGFWVGIDKEGLLPAKSQMERKDYKKGPIPPQDLLSAFLCYQIDSGIYPKGKICDHKAGLLLPLVCSSTRTPEDKIVSLKTNIADKCLEILGVSLSGKDFQGDAWQRINSFVRVKGADAVEDAFTEWAESSVGDRVNYPLSVFASRLEGMLKNTGSPKSGEEGKQLIDRLVDVGRGKSPFERKYETAIIRLLSEYEADEIVAAYREFYEPIGEDGYQIKHAARIFSETAGQLLRFRIRRKAEVLSRQAMIERVSQEGEARAAQELSEARKRADAEAEEVPDTLC